MKPPTMPRRLVRALTAAALLSTAAVTSNVTTAAADTSLLDITGFRTTNVSVSSDSCKYVPVTMLATQDPSAWLTDVTTTVYKGSQEVGSAFLEPNTPNTWLWCPWLDGYGTFTFGPSEVKVTTDDYADHVATDWTRGTVKVKARGTSAQKATRSGSYVSLLSTSSYYNYAIPGYSRIRGARVTIQYRPGGTSTWKTVTTRYANTSGQVSLRVYAPRAGSWRAVLAEGGQVFGATSASVYR